MGKNSKMGSGQGNLARRDFMITSAATGAAVAGAATLGAGSRGAQAADGMNAVRVHYLGGPTYMIEVGGFRIISDPGFDPQGSERNEGPGHLLTKIMEPPIPVDEIGPIDFAMVSHAQHLDNLDNEGRRLLTKVGQTFTTPDSAALLSETPNVNGLETWASAEVTNGDGQTVKVTAMPAVHTSNPELREVVGEVTGFMLEWEGQENGAFYISGDTVFIDDMAEIGQRYRVGAAILHMGRANIPAVGDNFLTMDGEQGAELTKLLDIPVVYPAHFEGWRHFPEGSWYILRDFEAAGVVDRLRLLRPGEAEDLKM